MSEQTKVENTNESSKKIKLPIVAILIFIGITIIVAIISVIIITRPINKINKAFSEGDIETVCELYDKLGSDEEINDTIERLLEYSKDLKKQFISEKMSYEDVCEQFDIIDRILSDNEEYIDIKEYVDLLNESRIMYFRALGKFEEGKYEEAYFDFIEVWEEDDNYQDAVERAEECLVLMGPIGSWIYSYDIGQYILGLLPFEISSEFSFEINICLDFNEDGTGRFYIDRDEINASYEALVSKVTDLIFGHIEQTFHVSKENVDTTMKLLTNQTVDEFVVSKISIEGITNLLSFINIDFGYEYADGNLTFVYGLSKGATYKRNANGTLELSTDDEKILGWGIQMPMIFEMKE